jgi:hypothetical protein
MLMAVAVVNRLCASTASALKQAGLEYVLFDEAQAQAIRSRAREAARPSEAPVARPRVSPSLPAERTQRNPARDMRQKNGFQMPPREISPQPEAKAPQAAPDPAGWPAVWQDRLRKTRRAPVVWTYWELGRDLCGVPDPKRRELLQALLKDLAHPPGTHSFWPLALPGQGGDGEQKLEANASVFWAGVRLLHSRVVMIMGPQALPSLALPDRLLAMLPFQQARHQGRLLIVLPSPDEFIQEARRIQSLREFLRQALAPFA